MLGGCENSEVTQEKEFCDLQNILQMLLDVNLSQQPVNCNLKFQPMLSLGGLYCLRKLFCYLLNTQLYLITVDWCIILACCGI